MTARLRDGAVNTVASSPTLCSFIPGGKMTVGFLSYASYQARLALGTEQPTDWVPCDLHQIKDESELLDNITHTSRGHDHRFLCATGTVDHSRQGDQKATATPQALRKKVDYLGGEQEPFIRQLTREKKPCSFAGLTQEAIDTMQEKYNEAGWFLCADGSSTRIENRCNSIPEDCVDNSDEHCSAEDFARQGRFYCGSAGYSIPTLWRCDGSEDCSLGSQGQPISDEDCTTAEYFKYARLRGNTYGSFVCGDRKKLIYFFQVCDKFTDCSDKTDELYCANETLVPVFTCANGNKIHQKWRCDGTDDCLDNSDEVYCSPYIYKEKGQFLCLNGKTIPLELRCNNYNDCGDDFYSNRGSDEFCVTREEYERFDHFLCDSGRIVTLDDRCNGSENCVDGSDEYCETQEMFAALGRFKCDGGKVIELSKVCDGQNNCFDEGTADRALSSDEACTEPASSPEKRQEAYKQLGHFLCQSGSRTISLAWHCDGDVDCCDPNLGSAPDRSDEENCHRLTTDTPAITTKATDITSTESTQTTSESIETTTRIYSKQSSLASIPQEGNTPIIGTSTVATTDFAIFDKGGLHPDRCRCPGDDSDEDSDEIADGERADDLTAGQSDQYAWNADNEAPDASSWETAWPYLVGAAAGIAATGAVVGLLVGCRKLYHHYQARRQPSNIEAASEQPMSPVSTTPSDCPLLTAELGTS